MFLTDAYFVAACACPEGPYIGARPALVPDCCERCGRLTQEQLNYIKAMALSEFAEEANGPDLPSGSGDWLDGACDTINFFERKARELRGEE